MDTVTFVKMMAELADVMDDWLAGFLGRAEAEDAPEYISSTLPHHMAIAALTVYTAAADTDEERREQQRLATELPERFRETVKEKMLRQGGDQYRTSE